MDRQRIKDAWDVRQALAWLEWRDEARVVSYAPPNGKYAQENDRRIELAARMYPTAASPVLPVRHMADDAARVLLLEALRNGDLNAFEAGIALDPLVWLDMTLDSDRAARCRFRDGDVRAVAEGRNADRPRPSPLKGAPRKPSVRGYAIADRPLIEAMRKLIDSNSAPNAWKAAEAVVERAAGGGTEDSKIKRLVARYAEVLSTEAEMLSSEED